MKPLAQIVEALVKPVLLLPVLLLIEIGQPGYALAFFVPILILIAFIAVVAIRAR